MVDPASGLDLGAPDEQIGTVRVKSIQPKYAVAELVDGQTAQRNDLVRPVNTEANP